MISAHTEVRSPAAEVVEEAHAGSAHGGLGGPQESIIFVPRQASFRTRTLGGKEDPQQYRLTLFHTTISKDTLEKYMTYVTMIIEFFKLLMACLLAVFVPQMCYAMGPKASAARMAEGDGECGFSELFLTASPYNVFVLVWNFCTLAMCVVHRSVTSQREAFMVDTFDVDRRLPPENIKEVLQTNPTLLHLLVDWNKRVYASALLFLIFNFLNFIFSAVLVWSRNSGYRTTTVFLTNISLLFQLIFFDLSVAHTSWKSNEALSLVNKDNRRYNALDHRKCSDPAVREVTGKVVDDTGMVID